MLMGAPRRLFGYVLSRLFVTAALNTAIHSWIDVGVPGSGVRFVVVSKRKSVLALLRPRFLGLCNHRLDASNHKPRVVPRLSFQRVIAASSVFSPSTLDDCCLSVEYLH